jgi:external thioesterase TEII
MEKPQLFLLHFAGGNLYSFDFIRPLLKNFEVITLELPGRGKRVREPLLRDFDLAAEDMYNQILNRLASRNFLIYGHSMGAYLALRVSNMLIKVQRYPDYLLVSGNTGPGAARETTNIYLLDKNEFKNKLENLGGFPAELLNNNELFDFFEPILRADFELIEKNGMDDEPAVSIPLFAMMGSLEEYVDNIANWGRFTTSQFNYEILEGHHFFIHSHPQRIADIIQECYSKVRFVQLQ